MAGRCARGGYSLHQSLLGGRLPEAPELFSRLDLIELGLEDRLLVLPHLLQPLHSFLLVQKSALLPDLLHPGLLLIRALLRTFCIAGLPFRFFLLFLKLKQQEELFPCQTWLIRGCSPSEDVTAAPSHIRRRAFN